MFTTIINDCRDDNTRARQESRIASLLRTTVSYVGVRSDIEASLQLIDIIDSTAGRPGLILVNVAPRGGHTNQWENGTPFAYFYYEDTLVISSVDGFALSGIKKLNLITEVNLLDTALAVRVMETVGFLTIEEARRIPGSQFRSFDFTPRVGAFLLKGEVLPSTAYPLSNVPDLPSAIWHIDNFGNCKTTLTKADLVDGQKLETRFGTLPYVEHLRDVPDNTMAVIEGSSGFGTTRWLELVVQRTPFATIHHANIGDDLFEPRSHLCTATSLEND